MSDPYMPEIRQKPKFLGNPDAAILIIMDASDKGAIKSGKILSGAHLSTLEECLHMAGLIFADVCVIDLIPGESDATRWWAPKKHAPTRDISIQIARARAILTSTKANVVLAMGDLSTFICTGRRHLTSDRGYVFPCSIDGITKKIMPVQDIQNMIWKNFFWRYYLASDLKKASKLSTSCILEYESKKPIIVEDFYKALDLLKFLNKEGGVVSIDIEVSNFQVSHIGFAIDGETGWSIPFRNDLWSEFQEVQLWKAVASLLSNSSVTKVGQNFIFDMSFLLSQNNILTRGYLLDTMMEQSLIFPDFSKGLGSLASIYLNVPSWKDMVKFKNIKEES